MKVVATVTKDICEWIDNKRFKDKKISIILTIDLSTITFLAYKKQFSTVHKAYKIGLTGLTLFTKWHLNQNVNKQSVKFASTNIGLRRNFLLPKIGRTSWKRIHWDHSILGKKLWKETRIFAVAFFIQKFCEINVIVEKWENFFVKSTL